MKHTSSLREALIAAQMEQYRKDRLATAALQQATDAAAKEKVSVKAPKPV